jgi:hypothetical protein
MPEKTVLHAETMHASKKLHASKKFACLKKRLACLNFFLQAQKQVLHAYKYANS